MSQRVPEVERLADALLGGVLGDDALLDAYRLAHQPGHLVLPCARGLEVGHRVRQRLHPCHGIRAVPDEDVLHHLGHAAQQVRLVEGGEERGAEHHVLGLVEGADLVLQSGEVDARLAPCGSVHHGQQGGGDVDVAYAALERGSGKAPDVGDDAPAQVQQQAVARGALLRERLPHEGQRVEVLVVVPCGDGDDVFGNSGQSGKSGGSG